MLGVGDIAIAVPALVMGGDDLPLGEHLDRGADDPHVHTKASEPEGHRVFNGVELDMFSEPSMCSALLSLEMRSG